MISNIEVTKTIFDNDAEEEEYLRKIDELIENDKRSYEETNAQIFAENDDDEDAEYMRKIDELIENDRLYYLEK